jgi:hypothetical protein
MDLIYPVRPLPGSTETVASNLDDAEWWLLHLQRQNPGVVFAAQCGPHIGGGSFAETFAVAQGSRHPVIHRFSRRDQDLVLPQRHRLLSCDFARSTPSWLASCLFGACPAVRRDRRRRDSRGDRARGGGCA